MYQISTMNLSMAVLNSWRSRSRLPSKNEGADVKAAVKRPAENSTLEDSFVESKRKCFPANRVASNQCHLVAGNHSSDDGISSSSSCTGLADSSSRPTSQLSTGSKIQSLEADSADLGKSSESYKNLMNLSHYGLRLGQTLEKAHSVILREQNESSIGSDDCEVLDQLFKLIDDSKQLNEKMMSSISSLFGVRTLGSYSSKVADLHKLHVEDKKRIDELTAQIQRLEQERTHKRGRNSSFSADYSSMEAEMEDDETPDHDLSEESSEFVDHLLETMSEHGLSRPHLQVWCEARHCKVSDTQLTYFYKKMLPEDRYKELIPLFKEFLAEATQPGWVDNFSAASPETTALINRCTGIVEMLEVSYSDFINWLYPKGKLPVTRSAFYLFLGKKLKDGERSQKIIPSFKLFVDEATDLLLGEDEDLSPETLEKIDNFNQFMEDHGLVLHDFNKWSVRHEQSLPPVAVHLFAKKKLKEEKCQQIAPLIEEFVEHKSTRVRTPSARSEFAKLSEEVAAAIDRQKRTMASLNIPAAHFLRWLAQQGQIVTANAFSAYINRKSSEARSRMFIPLVDKFLIEVEESKEGVLIVPTKVVPVRTPTKSAALSKESEEFIDHFRLQLAEYGITYKEVLEWLESSDFDVRMSYGEIKHYMTKTVSEKRCQEVNPALRELLEELTQHGSKSLSRRQFSVEATVILEEAFRTWDERCPDRKTCEELAEQIGDTPDRIKRWFGNRKYKGKRSN